jgi:DNA phosphorothioation-dependent restriction protein DptH
MTPGVKLVTAADLNQALGEVLEVHLHQLLQCRLPGHCMRVSDLDASLMVELGCKLAKALGERAQVHMLTAEKRDDDPLFITSTKLVELRNPLPDGVQRPPLMVFVPNELKASAEDSFGEATFESVALNDAYDQLNEKLMRSLPDAKRLQIQELIQVVEQSKWRWATTNVGRARFLLSLKLNGYEDDVIGASLFEVGLVPDFGLFEDPTKTPGRLAKNIDCVSKLTLSSRTERGRVLDLELAKTDLVGKLADFFVETGLENPLDWTKRLIAEQANWPLTFGFWEFEDRTAFNQQISVKVTALEIPILTADKTSDPKLQTLINSRVLLIGQGGPKSFKIKFRATPHPEKAPSVHHFRLQVISQATGSPVGLVKKKNSWRGGSAERGLTFTKLNKVDWEEGWHFVRVLAFTEGGDPIPLVDDEGKVIQTAPILDGESYKPRFNESDAFYVVKGDDVDLEPTQKAAPKQPSVAQALVKLKFDAVLENRDFALVRCEDVCWAASEDEIHTDGSDALQAKFGREGIVNVLVSRPLKQLEHRILNSPDDPISWRLVINNTQAEDVVNGLREWPKLEAVAPFLTARQSYFTKLLTGEKLLLSQAADFGMYRNEIAQYAERYLELVTQAMRRAEAQQGEGQRKAMEDLQKILALDTVEVELGDHRGERRKAVLVGPTHPLRALWLLVWSKLADDWLDKAAKSEQKFILPTRDALLSRLSLVNFPAVLAIGPGRIFTAVDNVHPFWTLYAAASDENPRGLIAETCTALDLPEPSLGSFALNGVYLADRVRRYLIQHPYVQTLTLNCFNAGRAKVISDMLVELQGNPDFRELRYDVRLFVPDPDVPGLGEDLGELILPNSALSEVADAFTIPTGTHLAPKLSYAVRSSADFRHAPAEFPAHISFLFDVFPAQEAGAEPLTDEEKQKHDGAPIHGLLQDFAVLYSEAGEVVSWRRRPKHALATPLPGAEDITDLLSRLSESLSNAAANVATHQSGLNLRPISKLVLTAEDKALLHQVHECSDWVFTVDKNLGIEFFDHNGQTGRPDYLIDHSPDLASNAGRRVVITSRSLTEIEAMFAQVLEEHGLQAEGNRAAAILGELRALSGRLALKLISSPSQRAEALGLAIGKLYLEYQEALADQVVIPLDAHLDWYRALQQNADELGDEVSLKRTDLGLFEFNAEQMTLTCRLVEVKCYQQTGGVAALNELKAEIAEQIQQSEQVLQFHFDPERTGMVDRPDREVKTQEFIAVLEFYIDRAARLGLMAREAFEEAKYFLRRMEEGYRLRFTRSALIFDFEKEGGESVTEENQIEFHRVGVNLIRALLQALPARRPEDGTHVLPAPPATEQQPVSRGEQLQRMEGTVPRLKSAAFIGPKRPHTVYWDKLRDRSSSRFDSDWAGGDGGRPMISPTAPKPAPAVPVVTAAKPEPSLPAKADEPAKIVTPVVAPTIHADAAKPASPPGTLVEPKVARSPGEQQSARCDVLLGETATSPQFGLLGKYHGRSIALDLNQTHTISLFGVQGGGKSYTLGSVIEMASKVIPGINELPNPLASIIFHYSQTQDYKPEFTSMDQPNNDGKAVQKLREEFGAIPAGMSDIVLLTPMDKLEVRREEYPEIEVLPLKFASKELQASHWRFLMGAVGNQAAYIRQLNQIMRGMRDRLTLSSLRDEVEHSDIPDGLKKLAQMRLKLAESYIDDAVQLSTVIRPGRVIIVDLRDEFIEKDEALGLFVVILQIFADAVWQGKRFNKLVVFDEAHKYIDNPDLIAGLIEVVREMRHKGTSVLVASQDPPSVPVALIELSTQIILHRFNSPAWLKHIQKANSALSSLTAEGLASLQPGEAFVWSSKSTDLAFSQQAVRIRCRPRVTRHGGYTKTAV